MEEKKKKKKKEEGIVSLRNEGPIQRRPTHFPLLIIPSPQYCKVDMKTNTDKQPNQVVRGVSSSESVGLVLLTSSLQLKQPLPGLLWPAPPSHSWSPTPPKKSIS